MPDVSLIIVSWNARRHLVNCLRSVQYGLKRFSGEVIVVDNQSSDGSPEAAQEAYPSALLIRNERNLGFAKANNIGIERAGGRYLALVNSDVIILPECLDRLIEFMDAHPQVGLAGPQVLNTDSTLQASHWDFPTVGNSLRRTLAVDTLWRKLTRAERQKELLDAEPTARPVDVLSGCFLLIRREAFAQVGGLDEGYFMYGEDMDLCRRYHQAGWGVEYYTGARAIHAGGASSANAPVRFFLEMQKANLRYWTKHHGLAGRAFYLANTLVHHLLRLPPNAALYLVRPSRRVSTGHKLLRSTACLDWALHSFGRRT